MFWGTVIAVLGVIDYHRHRQNDGSTLSEIIRWLFRTDTIEGRCVFLGAVALGVKHIFK